MELFLKDFMRRKAFVAQLAGLSVAALGLGIAIPYAFSFVAAIAPSLAPVFKVEGSEFGANVVYMPIGVLGLTGLCLIAEAWLLGYGKSSLKSILDDESPSVRTDFLFLLFRVSGLMAVFGLIFSLGGLYVAADFIESHLDFAVVGNIDSFTLQFLAMALLFSFMNYWFHRIMHTKLLWEIHKVHHSAQNYNVLLPYRNHPVDFIFATFYAAAAFAILGVGVDVLLAWLGANAVYQSMVHSHYDWKGRWLEYIFITPAAHRIHHSTAPEHFNSNYGIFSLWDRLFGTYIQPEGERINFGIPDPDQRDFNTGHFFAEIMACFWRWLGLKRPGAG